MGLRSAVTSAPVSMRSRSPVSFSAAQLGLEPSPATPPLAVQGQKLIVHPAELLPERRDQLLHRRLPFLKVPRGLGLGGLEL